MLRTDGSDGGTAFPIPAAEGYHQQEYGMSLRDWFAGKALGESTREIWTNHKPEDVAKRCYDLADAMIAERNK